MDGTFKFGVDWNGCSSFIYLFCFSTCLILRGWNYVECMEAIVLNESFQKGECWKLTTFCRDVTTLGKRSGNPSPLVLSLALVSGLLASLLVYFHMRSGYSKASEGEFGDVQFSQVRNTDHELMLT